MRLSATKYQTYDWCPLQFKYKYVDCLPTTITPELEFGSIVHKVIDDIQKILLKGKDVTSKTALRLLKKNWKPKSFDHKDQERWDSAVKMLEKFLAWHKDNPNKIVSTERWFSLERHDNEIVGKIDRIEKNTRGQLEVIDFKTGKKSVSDKTIHKDIQMNLYAIGADQEFGKTPIRASLFYLKTGKSVQYKITKTKRKDFDRRLRTMTKSIQKEKYEPKVGFYCNFCDFADICPAT